MTSSATPPSFIRLTKLTPPRRAGASTERTDLIERLRRAAEKRVVLFDAPAGFGKSDVLCSTYLSERECGRGAVWYSCENDENDLPALVSHLIEGGRQYVPAFGTSTLSLLSSNLAATDDMIATSFINDLYDLQTPLSFFVDDFHLITGDKIQILFSAILLSELPRIRFFIATRSSATLPVDKLELRGLISVYDASDLAFSDDEALDYFNSALETDISTDCARSLNRKIEGWAAGLQLAAISLSTSPDIDRIAGMFSGEDRRVTTFMAREVFANLEKRVQTFLLYTSILGRFNVDLARVLTGDSRCREILDELEAKNLFVFSLDTDRRWYRYHHLFSEFLHSLLTEEEPDAVSELHLKASRWLGDHKFYDEAIDHAYEAGDMDLFCGLLEKVSYTLFATGQTRRLRNYAAIVPKDLYDRLPHLQLDICWDATLRWEFDKARAALDIATCALESDDLETQGDDLDLLRDTLSHREWMLLALRDELEMAELEAQKWLNLQRTDNHFMCASAGSVAILSRADRFQVDGVDENSSRLLKRFIDGKAVYGTVFHNCIVSTAHLVAGDLDKAEATLSDARHRAIDIQSAASSLVAMPSILLSDVYYESNLLEEAAKLEAEYGVLATRLGFVDCLIARFVVGAKLAATRKDRDLAPAHEVLDIGESFAEKYDFRRLKVNILNERVRLLCLAGNADEALALCEAPEWRVLRENISPRMNVRTTTEVFAHAYCRALIGVQRARETIRPLGFWVEYTRSNGCLRPALRASLLLARALAAVGDFATAQRHIASAVTIGHNHKFIRAFLDEGPVIGQLIASIVTQGYLANDSGLRAFAEHLLELFREAGYNVAEWKQHGESSMADGQVPLSKRERRVLRAALDSASNAEIAADLGLSENTVKWYWQKIFAKLNVNRRHLAIKKARALGLFVGEQAE